MGGGGVKSPIYFHCVLHANTKKRAGGGVAVQIACKIAYVFSYSAILLLLRVKAWPIKYHFQLYKSYENASKDYTSVTVYPKISQRPKRCYFEIDERNKSYIHC